jgi:hypothetical protein
MKNLSMMERIVGSENFREMRLKYFDTAVCGRVRGREMDKDCPTNIRLIEDEALQDMVGRSDNLE